MKPFEETYTAWVDGRLTALAAAAFEATLEPDALADKSSAGRLGNLLRQHGAPALTNPDFFNHQLRQQIEADAPRPVEKERRSSGSWLFARLAWAGAAALVIGAVLFQMLIPKPTSAPAPDRLTAQVVSARPGGPGISATAFHSTDGVEVIWLDGLDYIPASHIIQ